MTDSPAILVAEDEEVVRRYIARFLAQTVHAVLLAAEGLEAWALMETGGREGVGLVVSDVSMPNMGGTELAARLAMRWPTLPVLLVSALDRPRECRAPFLPKPFTPDQLLAAAREMLGAEDRAGARQ